MQSAVAVLLQARIRQWRHGLNRALTTQKLQFALVVAFLGLFMAGTSVLFHYLFLLVKTQLPTAADQQAVLSHILPLLFFCLLVMLAFSNGILSWVVLFRSNESDGLLSWPLTEREIFVIRFIDSYLFSTWAFLVLVGPLLWSYVMVMEVSWWFFPSALILSMAYSVLAAAVGALVAVCIARFTPHHRKGILTALITLIVGLVAWFSLEARINREAGFRFMHNLHVFMQHWDFVSDSFLPSTWMTRAFQSFSVNAWGTGFFITGLLLVNGLMLLHVAGSLLDGHYLQCRENLRIGKKKKTSTLLSRIFGPRSRLRGSLLIIWKDSIVFLRDPSQWLQVLIFFGVLGIYFYNLNKFQMIGKLVDRRFVSFVNLIATLLTLSTFTARFVFPQISLEGRRFWILGLLPVERKTYLLSKMAFSLTGCLIISLTLVFLSAYKLNLSWMLIGLQTLVAFFISVGLCSLSVSLGVLFPDFKALSASKVVSGFGGTLNLIVCSFYMAASLGLCWPLMKYWHEGRQAEPLALFLMVCLVLLALLVSMIPYKMARRRMENIEF